MSILATSNLLSEVNGVIEEDQDEELRTSSRANFDASVAGRVDTLNSSVQLMEVGSSADMSIHPLPRTRFLLSPEVPISHAHSRSLSREHIEIPNTGPGPVLTQRQSVQQIEAAIGGADEPRTESNRALNI